MKLLLFRNLLVSIFFKFIIFMIHYVGMHVCSVGYACMHARMYHLEDRMMMLWHMYLHHVTSEWPCHLDTVAYTPHSNKTLTVFVQLHHDLDWVRSPRLLICTHIRTIINSPPPTSWVLSKIHSCILPPGTSNHLFSGMQLVEPEERLNRKRGTLQLCSVWCD